MGFEDIKVDGLSIDKLEKEIESYNDRYFGKINFGMDNSPKGQYELYKEAEKRFLDEQAKMFKAYFKKMGWDENGCTMRANDKIYMEFDSEKGYIQFYNGTEKKTYGVKARSDFRDNPHFCIDTNSHGWKRYTNIGGRPTRANDIKKQLEDIKEVMEFNEKLNGKYNFTILVSIRVVQTHRL